MVSEKVDIVRQQQGESLLHPPGDAPILSTPEQAMMDKNGVSLCSNRGLDQGPARSNAGHDLANYRPALYLKPIGAEILEFLGLQQRVESP